MNYINTLQTIVADRGARLEALHSEVEWMRLHLLSDKFVGVDQDGERKDWVATSDVLRFIERLRAA